MEQIRTFVAIELDDSIKAGLTELQKRLKAEAPPGAVRWVRPDGIHLTLKFLGNVPASRIKEITRAIAGACRGFGPLLLSVGGLGCFPNSRRPRVLWVGVEEPTGALAKLQRAIEEALAGLGFPPEGRSFHPHLTLGRTQRRVSSGDVRRLGQLVEETEIGQLGRMEAKAISLMRSDLKPTGAVYTRLAAIKLEGKEENEESKNVSSKPL